MTTVLIPTIQDDIHAAAVARVLEEMGHRPIRWFCGDLPEVGMASFSIGSEAPESMSLREGSTVSALDTVDVFWNRRVGTPVVQSPLLPCDKEFATRESNLFVQGLLTTISDHVFSVNDYQRARAAENKILQLHAAREVGFALPETLISNDPRRIRAFLREHEASGAVFKSFRPVTWENEARVAILYTSRIELDDLPEDPVLRLSPSIFQAYVPKAFEVRVTCMGAELMAAQLHSQSTRDGMVDWRIASPDDMRITPIELPEQVRHKCRALMKHLGLVFGCFDLVVTPAGEYVFLEINQMGQFLWVEDRNPEIPLLHAFCQFIVSRDPEFRYSPTERRATFAAVCESATAMVEHDRRIRVPPERYQHIVHE